MLDLIRANTLIASLILTAGMYAQAWRIHANKSADDFTPLLIIAILYGEISWLLYGSAIQEWPILVVTLVNLPAEIAIATGYFMYRRKEKCRDDNDSVR